MKASMPPSSSSGTCSVSRRSESGSYSTIARLPSTVASNRPRSGSALTLPGLCTLATTGGAVSTRQLTALRICLRFAAGSLRSAFLSAASTRSRKTLWSPKSMPPSTSRSLVAASTRRPSRSQVLGSSSFFFFFGDHNVFRARVDAALKKADLKLPAANLKQILKAVSWRVETAPPVVAKVHKPGKVNADPLRGLFDATVDGKRAIVEYEPDSDLRDTEQVPLLEDGGIEAFIRCEVLPYTPDAWIKGDATKIGYEVSFTRHFYKPQPLRTLEEISADILAIEKEAEGLLDGLLKVGAK